MKQVSVKDTLLIYSRVPLYYGHEVLLSRSSIIADSIWTLCQLIKLDVEEKIKK